MHPLCFTAYHRGASGFMSLMSPGAHEDSQSGKLSDSHLSNLRTLLPKLPKSAANKPPISRTVVISFERDGKWCTETYDSSKLPETLERIMLIVDERFERNRESTAKAAK